MFYTTKFRTYLLYHNLTVYLFATHHYFDKINSSSKAIGVQADFLFSGIANARFGAHKLTAGIVEIDLQIIGFGKADIYFNLTFSRIGEKFAHFQLSALRTDHHQFRKRKTAIKIGLFKAVVVYLTFANRLIGEIIFFWLGACTGTHHELQGFEIFGVFAALQFKTGIIFLRFGAPMQFDIVIDCLCFESR